MTTRDQSKRRTRKHKPARLAPEQAPRSTLRPSRFRLMPITMMMAVLLLGVKVGDVYQNGRKLSDMIQVQRAHAQEGGQTAATGGAADAPATQTAADAGQDATANANNPAAALENSEQKAQDAAIVQKETAASEGPDSVQLAKLQDASDTGSKTEQKKEFSQIELDILQSLSERREELEKRAQEMDLKEKLLEATELRINDKISEIRGLKVEVEKLLEAYNKEETSKIQSLVKIYENMKPKDAAQIFNQLDMPILLEVIAKMSERKAAPILAQMDPIKAKELTVDLARLLELRKVPRTLGAAE